MADELLDRELLRALGHPLRLRILEAIIDSGELSPVALHRRFGVPLATISRHVRTLSDLGYVELTRTAPRRGAVEHFYKAAKVPFIKDDEWEELPVALRRGIARQTFRKVVHEAAAAGTDGGFDGTNAIIVRVPLGLDETGEQELSAAVSSLIREAEAIRERAETRAASRRDQDGGLSTTSLAVLHFRRPCPSTPTEPPSGSPQRPPTRPRFPE